MELGGLGSYNPWCLIMITLYNTYKYTNEVGSPVAQRVHNNMEACGISDGTWGGTKLGNLGPRRNQEAHCSSWAYQGMDFMHLSIQPQFYASRYTWIRAYGNHFKVCGNTHMNTSMATYDSGVAFVFQQQQKFQKGTTLGSIQYMLGCWGT